MGTTVKSIDKAKGAPAHTDASPMTTPEQLPLDFSAPPQESAPVSQAPATVISMLPFRQAREAQRLRATYQAIFDSISHIRLDRVRPKDGDW